MVRSPAIFLVSLLSVLLFFGLAILGRGGIGPFFASPARTALAAATLLLTLAAMFTTANLSTGEREDRGNRWVLAAFAVIGILSAFLPAYTERKAFWTFGGDGVRWLGVAIFTLGGVLRLWPVFVLGRRFSGLVAIQRGHTLVTTGIYGAIRHPSYLGLLLNQLGWGLAFRSGVGLIVAALTLVPVIGRIRAEEKLLGTQFGAAYENYRSRTWRLVPGVY